MASRTRRSSAERRRSICIAGASSWCAIGAIAINGCVSQMLCDGPTGPCVETGGADEAAATAALAAAAWVGGGGCAIAGCRPPMTCNTGSGFCEHVRCGEGQACPPATRCDSITGTCR